MSILNNMPINLDTEEVKKKLCLNRKLRDAAETEETIRMGKSLLHPSVTYRVSYIDDKAESTVKISGVTFTSRILRKNLEKAEKVFPFIITVGNELEKKASSINNLLKQYYLETIGDIALEACRKYLEAHLKKKYGIEKLAYMSPGSLKEWPITEQKFLFSLFHEKENRLGVRLTDKMLMIPRKSLSGFFFPTKVTFLSCQLCPRERCPSRSAPYDESLLKKYLNNTP